MNVPVPFNPTAGQYAPIAKPAPEITRCGLFQVIEDRGDYLLCQGLDPEHQRTYDQANPVSVAKPYLLMRSPWDGQVLTMEGTTFLISYTGKDSRVLTKGTLSGGVFVPEEGTPPVIQSLEPGYFGGDILAVARSRTLAGDATGLVDEWEKPVEFVDLNVGARHWNPSGAGGLKVYFGIIRTDTDATASTVACDIYAEEFGAAATGQSPATGLYAAPVAENVPCIRGTGSFRRQELVAISYFDNAHRMEKLARSVLRHRIPVGYVGMSYRGRVPMFEATSLMDHWDAMAGSSETYAWEWGGKAGVQEFPKWDGDICCWPLLTSQLRSALSNRTIYNPDLHFPGWKHGTAHFINSPGEYTYYNSFKWVTLNYWAAHDGPVSLPGTVTITNQRTATWQTGSSVAPLSTFSRDLTTQLRHVVESIPSNARPAPFLTHVNRVHYRGLGTGGSSFQSESDIPALTLSEPPSPVQSPTQYWRVYSYHINNDMWNNYSSHDLFYKWEWF